MNLKDMRPSLRPVLFSVAIAVVCAVAATLAVVAATRTQVVVGAPAPVPQSSSFTPGVFASGDATVSKKPDIAFLSVGVESLKPTASAAQNDLASKAAKLIARAKALGIVDKDISTSGYSVGPNYGNSNATIDGYRASEQIQLKWHNVETVGGALDSLVPQGGGVCASLARQGGASKVGCGFGLANPKAAKAEARALAIMDARTRAQGMAD